MLVDVVKWFASWCIKMVGLALYCSSSGYGERQVGWMSSSGNWFIRSFIPSVRELSHSISPFARKSHCSTGRLGWEGPETAFGADNVATAGAWWVEYTVVVCVVSVCGERDEVATAGISLLASFDSCVAIQRVDVETDGSDVDSLGKRACA